MKNLFAFLGIGALVLGCGGSSADTDAGADGSTTADGSKPDASTDGGTDTGVADTGVDTGNGNDGGGLTDGGIECMNPTTCGNNPFCCATITAGQGNPPNCFYSGTYATKCTMTCATSFNPQCGTTSTRRLCSLKSQCTENAYPECCTVMLMNQSVSVCMSGTEAQLANAACK